jgi:predicted Zn-dependent protease with MMP-like domain
MRLVDEAVATLPDGYRERLAGVTFTVEETPAPEDMRESGLLLGMFRGSRPSRPPAATERPQGRVVLFRRPIEARARSEADMAAIVREVVVQHVARLLGIDEDRLDELGW